MFLYELILIWNHVRQDSHFVPRIVDFFQYRSHFPAEFFHNLAVLLQRQVVHLVRIFRIMEKQRFGEAACLFIYIQSNGIVLSLESAGTREVGQHFLVGVLSAT